MNLLTSRLSSSIYATRIIKYNSNENIAKMAHYTTFHSVLQYSTEFWRVATNSSGVFLIQTKALWIVFGLLIRESYREI